MSDQQEEKKLQGISLDPVVVTQKTSDYPEPHRGLVRWLFSYSLDKGWKSKDVERETKISWTTLYRIWVGEYRNPDTGEAIDLGSICERIEHFKRLAETRDAAGRLPFIETSVWARIEKVCREALIGQCFGFIYGESQIGKTECLLEVKRRYNHGQTNYVLTPASSGPQAFLQAIAASCHISTRTNFMTIRERVFRYFDHTKLLILDEVHECFLSFHVSAMRKSLALVRQLQETTGCGVVLCGTNAFRNQLEQGEFTQELKQLKKRGIWELQLEDKPTAEDLQKIAAHYRLGKPTGEAAGYVKEIAERHGLGKYTKFLARAAREAAERKQRFNWDHFAEIVSVAEILSQKPTTLDGRVR